MSENWLHTEINWQSQVFDDGTQCDVAVLQHRKARLPWVRDLSRLLVALNREYGTLGIYRTDKIPSVLPLSGMVTSLTRPNMLKINEFFEWPQATAIYHGFTGMNLPDGMPTLTLSDALGTNFRVEPVAGWQPCHRGALGLSFLRDSADGTYCIEATVDRVRIYRGPIEDNQGLDDHRVLKSFRINELVMPRLTKYVSRPDAVSIRLMERYIALWVFEESVAQDLPF